MKMPATSEKQRRAAGAALHAKRSGTPTQGSSKSMAKTMTVEELRDFAKKPKSKGTS